MDWACGQFAYPQNIPFSMCFNTPAPCAFIGVGHCSVCPKMPHKCFNCAFPSVADYPCPAFSTLQLLRSTRAAIHDLSVLSLAAKLGLTPRLPHNALTGSSQHVTVSLCQLPLHSLWMDIQWFPFYRDHYVKIMSWLGFCCHEETIRPRQLL